tara:strand:+ start:235 stop:519 length:285 start_codon:yes stop_codon:yes gene_type:complete
MKLTETKLIDVSVIDAEIKEIDKNLQLHPVVGLYRHGLVARKNALEWVKSQAKPSEPLAEVCYEAGMSFMADMVDDKPIAKADFLTSDIELKTN